MEKIDTDYKWRTSAKLSKMRYNGDVVSFNILGFRPFLVRGPSEGA